jgi:hypothetical protein
MGLGCSKGAQEEKKEQVKWAWASSSSLSSLSLQKSSNPETDVVARVAKWIKGRLLLDILQGKSNLTQVIETENKFYATLDDRSHSVARSHLKRFAKVVFATCAANKENESDIRFRAALMECRLAEPLKARMFIALRPIPEIKWHEFRNYDYDADFNPAFGEILPSWINVEQTDDYNKNKTFREIWQNAKVVVDLGMGYGRFILQLLLWYHYYGLPVTIYGYELSPRKFQTAQQYLQQTRDHMDDVTSFLIHCQNAKNHATVKNRRPIVTKGCESKRSCRLIPVFADGLTHDQDKISQTDFFIFDIAVDFKQTRQRWREFFFKAKQGAAVLVFKDDTDDPIFPNSLWHIKTITLPATWASSPGHRFLLCVRRRNL